MDITSPVVKSFLAGIVSGSCSTILFQPLDLVKTRIQLQANLNVGSHLRMSSVVSTVIQQDRVVGLWRGLAPSFSRGVPGIGIYFSSVHYLKSNFGSKKPKPLESVVIGAVARTMAGVIVIPFTVLKTRYESGQFKYNGLVRALLHTYKTEGITALYCGLSPTLIRDVPFSGIYLMFYTLFKQMVNEVKKKVMHSSMDSFEEIDKIDQQYLPFVHFICGVNAGALAATLTQPADVVKTHMQLYPKKHAKIADTVKYIYEKNGLQGFMKGIVPRTIRRTLMAAMAWTIYDEMASRCGLK